MHTGRIHLLTTFVLLCGAFFIAKLYTVQVVEGEEFNARAHNQYIRPNYSFDRGSIFFTTSAGEEMSAATLASGFTLAINPRLIAEPDVVFNQLSALIPLDEADFFARVSRTNDPYEEIAHRLDSALAERIDALALPGVSLIRESWRYYPGGTLAAHTLGFMAFNGDTLRGQYGLETYYDDVLSRTGTDLSVNFFAELFGNLTGSSLRGSDDKTDESVYGSDARVQKLKSAAEREGDLVLTIEPSVQLFLENRLAQLQEEWDSRLSGGIIMHPKTGAIYAMAAIPSFDLNAFDMVDDPRLFVNPLVENVYEMGSIIKAITMAIGLDSGVITSKSTYFDAGTALYSGARISNYDGRGRGEVSMQIVLNDSLNTGAAYIAHKVGGTQFTDYLKKFGVGEETGIDLPNEAHGLVDNLNSARDIEIATASFGQGIALTPVATIRALSALANKGRPVTPHVVKEVRNTLGTVRPLSFEEQEHVISPHSAEEVTSMLVRVVDEALKGGTVSLPRYSIAAKTGTAQMAYEDGQAGYADDRFFHSFFGYFPAYDPEFLILFFTQEPQGARYASETLTDPFMESVDFLLNYYTVPPDR